MARIFRALLIAAVNAIQEFFAFATDNGESQVGDSVKLNDGMATSNYDWSAYPENDVSGIIWTQPILSSNGTLGGDNFAVSGTNVSGDYYTWKAFDNNDQTLYYTTTLPAEIIMYNPKALRVTQLDYIMYNTSRIPTSWEWYGSNDNSTYELITSGTRSGAGSNFTIKISKSKYYKYHKLKILTTYNNQLDAKQINLTAYTEAPFSVTGTIEKVKQIGNDFVYGMQEPEQDNKDVTVNAGEIYYAYTNENDSDDSVYTPDDPISKGAFILENATNNGCTIDSDMAYGSSNNKIIVNNISNLNTYSSWSFNTKFVYNGGGGANYGQQVLGVGSGHGIRLGTLPNNRLFCCLSSQDGSWTIAGDGTYLNKTLTVGNTYYLQFGYDGTQYYCKCEETPITQGTNPIWTLKSPLKVNTSSNLWLLNYHYSSGSEYFAGPIYLNETNFVLNGFTITFGYFTNPSILYDDTFTALNPQPTFTVGINSITVTSETPNITYNKNTDNNKVKSIECTINTVDNTTINSVSIISDQTATIETSASATTSNNDNVVSGTDWHIFNLTAPQNITTYIQSGGIEFTPLNMPLLLKKDVGVGLLLKNGNNAQYRNHWVLTRDFDLHYQELQFSTNVTQPTILVNINNVNTDSPYYFYNGDTYKYKISKEDYCDYEGSGAATYTSADKIITVEAELVASNGTVDVTDYEYTLNNTGNMVLTKYIGSSTDVTVPNI